MPALESAIQAATTDLVIYGQAAQLNVVQVTTSYYDPARVSFRIDPACLVLELADGGAVRRPTIRHHLACDCRMVE